MNTFQKFTTVVLFLLSTVIYSQTTVTGTVTDNAGYLPGATILEKGTTNGTTSNFEGTFSLDVGSESGEIEISYLGYVTVTISYSGATDVGTITLQEDADSLEEVVLVGTGVIDLAEGRKTPIAVSTIKAKEIQDKIGAQDVTMALVNTPSVYVAGQAGGYGDSRIAVRGFGQDNTAYLLNGQPINGMEDGKMYWSNWSGMSDIANVIQTQRGLGSSKLAISSVGGTTNFVTKSTDKRESGFGHFGVANNNYFKTTIAYNSGRSQNGWGASVMFSHWQGDGYNEGNKGQGQNYFISIGYQANERHNFNFLLTGAPQWHDQNFTKKLEDYETYGDRYNNNWGTYQGKYMTERRNFYHKPVMNLNWDFAINESSNLSTVLYASWGRGGGTGNRGKRIRTDEGYIDYDAIYAFNESVPNGEGGYFAAGGGYVTRSSVNSHSWYGVVSNYEKNFNDNLTFNVGIDYRYYYGYHHRVVENFHGLSSWQENIRLRDQNNNHETYGYFGTYKNVIATENYDADPWAAVTAKAPEDQKIAYSNNERITYGGLFSQLEYADENFSVFVQGSISNQNHQRFDYYQYADQALIDGTSTQNVIDEDTGQPVPLPSNIEPGVDSEKVSNFGFNIKGGGAYFINSQSSLYANIGYYSRQPYHDNIYLNFTNQVNPLTENEKIFGMELGYKYSSPKFSGSVNLYSTSWKDRVVTSSDVEDDVVLFTTNFGVEQLHMGIELDGAYRITDALRVRGFLSLGNWRYKGDAISRVSDEDQNIIEETVVDVDGGEVGDAAQTTFGLGGDWKITERFSIDADYRFYDNLYSRVGAVKENLKLPSFGIMDFGASYRLPVGQKNHNLYFRGNINNLFDTNYISGLSTNIESGDDNANGTDYYGVDSANRGFIGLGITWNVSVRYNF
ncbi:MAG: TonB-dependent receptor plug domain-containing protein [Flavobacteriales bacterium]|nr:TonB-dependent receptor plug domain-containing protein [Flavobacteriales bacterium]